MNTGKLAIIACFIATAAQAATPSTDPLFSKMEGQWKGAGTRNYPISGRETQVEADVVSTVTLANGQARLTSDNKITETASGVAPQTYESDYWIEATPGKSGQYSLGTGDAAPTSDGTLQTEGGSLAFVSDQSLGNDYNIHSETLFTSTGPLYTETVTNGNQVILRSVIQYLLVQ